MINLKKIRKKKYNLLKKRMKKMIWLISNLLAKQISLMIWMISQQYCQKIKATKTTKKLMIQLKYLEEQGKRKRNNKIGLITIL